MKGKILGWIAAFVIISLAYNAITARLDVRAVREELIELKKNNDLVLRFDSILTAQEHRFIDSLNVVKKSAEEDKRVQADENKKLRRQNIELQKRFDSIVINGRPTF